MLNNNINPNFRTNPKDYSKVEIAKINSSELRGNLFNEFRDYSSQNISWESEQIAKSHGIYLEFNRARTGNEKDWMYMLRISIPGGGPITSQQWNILDRIADTYTIGPSDAYPTTNNNSNARPSLRITTRQNIQLHWVRKENVVDAIKEIAKSGFFTINGCGDNTRNVIGCPLSFYSKIFNANKWAQKIGKYFALPTAAYIEVFEIDPNYLRKAGLLDREVGATRFDYGTNQLNRKFKIAFSAIHYDVEKKRYIHDNCVELRTNDIGIAPIVNDDNGKVDRFQVYVGGSQGQQSGKPTFSTLGEPFGIFTEDNLLEGLDAIVRVHKEWGDRENRHWARLKYLVKIKGIQWLREQVKDVVVDNGSNSRINFELPIQGYDYGDRNLHLGWIKQDTDEVDDSINNNNTKWCYGVFIENGRIIDGSSNGNLKSMVKFLMDKYPNALIFTTPNQHLLFSNLASNEKEQFKKDMMIFGYGIRKVTLDATNNRNDNNDSMSSSSSKSKIIQQQRPYSKLRMLSGACVGRDTCRLTYTDSEKFEPSLLDQLEDKWGDLNESIGVTGCEKQCYRPATKTVGWIGTGFNLYQLTIMGTEDGRHQGGPLIDSDTKEQYLRFVPRKDVAAVTDTLFEFFIKNRSKEGGGEEEIRPGGMGYFLRRIGAKEIIYYLKSNPKTKDLMKKTFKVQ
jgi:sulfite reductase (NADPH) hemoprotein beta-component